MYDKEGMLALLRGFPEQCELALEIAGRYPLEMKKQTYENIFIQGMGGSGIGGVIARDLLKERCSLPIVANNNYSIPKFVGKKTLAFFVSYSGNTEETLSCFRKAKARKAAAICISSDGKLARACKNCIRVPQGNPPRTMLAFLSLPILETIKRMGLLEGPLALETLPKFLRREMRAAERTGKKLAKALYRMVPVIYAASPYGAAALRFHTQLAENAGTFSHWNVLPEANHNEIVGFRPRERALVFVLFRSRDENERMKIRFEFTKKLVSKKSECIEIWAKGRTHAEHLFYAILVGDFASYYLALLNRKNPNEIDNIRALKKILQR